MIIYSLSLLSPSRQRMVDTSACMGKHWTVISSLHDRNESDELCLYGDGSLTPSDEQRLRGAYESKKTMYGVRGYVSSVLEPYVTVRCDEPEELFVESMFRDDQYDFLYYFTHWITEKYDFFKENALPPNTIPQYIDAIESELMEVRAEDKEQNTLCLEDELGDVLWNYFNLVILAQREKKIRSRKHVLAHAFYKFAYRVSQRKKGENRAAIKHIQKEDFEKRRSPENRGE